MDIITGWIASNAIGWLIGVIVTPVILAIWVQLNVEKAITVAAKFIVSWTNKLPDGAEAKIENSIAESLIEAAKIIKS